MPPSPTEALPQRDSPSLALSSPAGRWSRAWPWLVALMPWVILINYLRLEWSANEQYGYGFVVPFLSLYLVLQRWPTRPEPKPLNQPFVLLIVAVLLGILLAPLLPLVEASPEWRILGWLLALVTTGLTSCLVLYRGGWPWLRHFAFPLFFICTAVPWPTSMEFKIMLPLMQVDAATAVEVLNWIGIPAVQHQNVIGLPNGTVGVDEACSGIRSLQTSLMITLFVGEWLQFNFLRRLGLLAGAVMLTFLFNLLRTLLLVALSANLGKEGMERWHDTVGLAILTLSLAGLWALSVLIKGRKAPPGALSTSTPRSALAPWPKRILVAFSLWFFVAEATTQAWFDWHEAHAPPFIRWVAQWPRDIPTFQSVEIPEDVRTTFMYDTEASSAARWQRLDSGSLWLGYFLRWLPGRETSIVASTHHPDVCLPASGKQLANDYGTTHFQAAGLDLPFQVYQFNDGGQPLFVFYCVWTDGHSLTNEPQVYPETDLNPKHVSLFATLRRIFLPFTPASSLDYRLQAIAHGQRNRGQQVLEMGLWGSKTVEEAKAEFAHELPKLVSREP